MDLQASLFSIKPTHHHNSTQLYVNGEQYVIPFVYSFGSL